MTTTTTKVSEIGPAAAWEVLSSNPSARMVDVRTKAEWSFVGLPDLSSTGKRVWTVEWVGFPSMAPNPRFLQELTELASADPDLGGSMPETLLFICRSGARSMMAARTVALEGEATGIGAPAHCINVAEGFEGDLDADGHRGNKNGWKVAELPWRQG
ncbi:MAG: rhodanese-like domain-containing protein [Pseudomonadota bacterium]